MGSGERLEIQTEITNKGEDAFNALLEVQLPMGVSYINANTTDPNVNILCSPPTPMNNNTVQCEVGNPLKANKQVTARVYVMPSSDGFVDIPVSEFSFLVNARSSNPEEGGEGDNFEEFTVPIRVETDFRVTGKSDPLEVEYNISAPLPSKYEYEDEIGEEVRHIYDVKNKGPTSISEAEVYILWPSYNEYEDPLLYLLDFTASDKAYCEPYKNKNPLMVKVQGTRAYEEFMAAQQIQYESSSSSQSSSSNRYSGSSSYSSKSSYSSSSSSSSRSQSNEGFGGRMTSFSDSDDDDRMVNVNVVTGAARGPGDYHGTMSKAELEREAGGRVFGVNHGHSQVENTRYGGQARYQGAVVADGAEETRLFDTQGQLIVKKKSDSEAPTEPPVYLTQSGSSSSSNKNKNEDVVYSGWKLLDNGTYIRVYDNQQSSGSSSQGYSGSSSSSSSSYSSSSSSSGSGSGYGYGQRTSSEQITLDNQEKSSSSSDDYDDNSGYMNTGWVQQPDGTYIRKQSSWSSSSSSSSSSSRGSGGSSQGSGSEYSAGSSSSGNRGYSSSSGSGSYSSSNNVFGAAQGPGDYHGTMSKAELEREAGGRIFSGSSSQETRQQVENTRYRGGAAAGESYSDDNDVVVTKGGRWVWSETNNKWEWEEAGGGGGSRLSGNNVQTDSGSDDSGWVQLSNGTWTRRQSSWSSSSSSQSGVRYGGGSQGGVATGAMVNGGQAGEWGDQGNNSTGWVTMPDGTMVKKSSSWASWSSSSYDDAPGGNSLDHVQRQLEHRVRNNLDRQLPSNVEPGFENEYQRNRRHKRQASR